MTCVTATFNNIDLSQYLNIQRGLQRGVTTERQVKTYEVGTSDFSKRKNSRYASKTITMPFTFVNDIKSKQRELAGILNTDGAKRLIFSDEPNLYYNAELQGKVDLDEMIIVGFGTIEWLVVDGVAHSIDDFEETATGDTITVDYNGTYKTKPILSAEMKSDNGVVAFINKNNGALLQFGDPSTADTQPTQLSELIVNDRVLTQANFTASGWQVNAETFPNLIGGQHSITVDGNIQFRTINGRNVIGVQSYGTGTQYHGPTISRLVSPDINGHVGAKNFEFRYIPYWLTGQIPQTGLSLFELRDINDNQVCSVYYLKNATTNNRAVVRLNVNGTMFYEQSFNADMYNVFTSQFSESSIVKRGSLFELHLGGLQNGGFVKTYTDPSMENVEVAKVIWFAGVFGNSQWMENTVASFTLRKDNVDTIIDIPNLFSKGDVLEVDTNTNTVFINGLQTTRLGYLGNDFDRFYFEQGLNEVLCINSSWVAPENIPTFKAKYKENYL